VLKVGRGATAPPFIVMDVIAAANARQASQPPGSPAVIRMEVGQPGTGAPAGAAEAVAAALRSGDVLGYTEAFGRRSLRERIVAHYLSWYGLAVPIERVAVTVGASGAFPLAFLAAFDPGDRVALTSPFYPPYVNILTALGMRPVVLEAGPETRFQPSVAMLEKLDPPPDGLIVASPCNPVGTMLHPDELSAIAAWCDGAGVRLISDEIYHGLNYDSPIATAAAHSAHAVVVNSFSKYFSMNAWHRICSSARRSYRRWRRKRRSNATTNCVRTSRAIDARAIACCAPCPRPASLGCPRPKARSICSPTSPIDRTTALRSVHACWRRSGSPRRQEWISIAPAATAFCGFRIAGWRPILWRPRRG
jgi:aspartate/methionine/tyrosine aminotransferase